MSVFSVSCFIVGAVAMWGLFLGVKVLMRIWSYRSSKNAAKRYNMRESSMRVRLDKCPGEYCVLDMSQSGMALFIDHFVDGFSLAKRTKFVLRNNYGDVPTRLITGKVIYLKQLPHGYRMGIQFDDPLDLEVVKAFRAEHEAAANQEQEVEIAA